MADSLRTRGGLRRGGGRGTGPPAEGRLGLDLYGRAWRQALETARRLVYEFGAARVLAVGDLVRPEHFDRGSRIELVAWGLHADVFTRVAVAGRPDAVPAVIRDGDRLTGPAAAAARAEGVELAHRAP